MAIRNVVAFCIR